MTTSHKTQAVVFTCIDFRFQKPIEEDLKNRGLTGKFDRIAIAGATKNFAVVSENADISLGLHDPDEALIYEHEDCGAYGQDNSQKAHKANAQKLESYLKQKKPNIKVATFIAAFEGIKDL